MVLTPIQDPARTISILLHCAPGLALFGSYPLRIGEATSAARKLPLPFFRHSASYNFARLGINDKKTVSEASPTHFITVIGVGIQSLLTKEGGIAT